VDSRTVIDSDRRHTLPFLTWRNDTACHIDRAKIDSANVETSLEEISSAPQAYPAY
jgi:hypothetical protein